VSETLDPTAKHHRIALIIINHRAKHRSNILLFDGVHFLAILLYSIIDERSSE